MRCLSMVAAIATALLLGSCACCDKRTERTEVSMERKGECGAYVLIPAKYETVMEQVCVEQPSTRTEVVEAKYQTVNETVVDVPGHWVDRSSQAEYKDVCEQVQVAPGRKEWQKADCAQVDLKPGEKRGDAYCLVDIPPQYETRTKRVCTKEACSQRQWVEPVYKTVERRVLMSAARNIEVPVQGRYEMRARQDLVSPERWEWRWGNECPLDEKQIDLSEKANRPSPAPPFPVGSPSTLPQGYGTTLDQNPNGYRSNTEPQNGFIR